MSQYPAARALSVSILEHMRRRHVPNADVPGSNSQATLPSLEAIEAMMDAAFWASLRREEGRTPLLSLAFVRAEQVEHALVLERPITLAPEPLTRLGPAVERPGIHLGVSQRGEQLTVWGATRELPRRCFVLEVIAPGFLILKESPAEDAGKFLNIAVVQGDEVKFVDHAGAGAPGAPELLKSLLGFDWQDPAHSSSVLIQLAVSMRAHARGGTLLIVPSDTTAWQESILTPILYSLSPPSPLLADLLNAPAKLRATRPSQDALHRAVEAVAGLTAVDGATVVTDSYELLAFGAKIMPRSGSPLITRLVMTEPIENSRPLPIEPAQLGGTRHLSAAQFAHDQHDAVALVASQDGRFTVFAWCPREHVVHAHRIEALLL